MSFEILAAVLAVLAPGAVTAAGQQKTAIELNSDVIVGGLPIAESKKGVYGIALKAQVDKKGDGGGTLELDPNAPVYDELGFQQAGANLPLLKLECTIKIVKKKKVTLRESPRIAAPLVEVQYVLYQLSGPKITTPLFLATEDGVLGGWARLLVHDKDGKVRHMVPLRAPPPPPPCHPGCFPAGTEVRVPGGTRPIERLGEGDPVTTIAADGTVAVRKVVSVFRTTNRLVEVGTDEGNLTTTQTQPLALADGGLRPAGDLKPGDRIWRWDGRARRAVTVRSVSATGREAPVFNVVLGEQTMFVADGFVVGSKPPGVVEPAPARAEGARQEP